MAALLPAAAGAAASRLPGHPPALCAGNLFSDDIGTNGSDTLTASNRPMRLWGRAGPDRLTGSATRASCLFGGRDPDVLRLLDGGGLAIGEHGSDLLAGGGRDDVLLGGDGNDVLVGGAGNDTLDGNRGVDGFAAGPGDDHVAARDGRAEIVDCGAGEDSAVTDRVDVVLGCEHATRSGVALPYLVPSPRAAAQDGRVSFVFHVPEAARRGGYRVLLLTGAQGRDCAGGPRDIVRLGKVRAEARVRVTVRPPARGWCPGLVKLAVVLHRSCKARRGCAAPPPPEPLARLSFRTAGSPYYVPLT